MPDLSTNYMGLDLKNPLIVASSNLTSKLEDVVACGKAGAGAVVLKSLFEEQIRADSTDIIDNSETMGHSEAMAFFSGMGKNFYLNDYLKLIREAKEQLDIPVIASLNCVTDGAWMDYAGDLQQAGADALELNVFIIPAHVKTKSSEIEEVYFRITRKIKKQVKIPVSMKIGSYFSGLGNTVKSLGEEGIDGFVLFNRFYRPDVDIDAMKVKPAHIFSQPQEISQSLQWIAILSGDVDCDFAASTGVHDAEGVIKQLLVGAKAIQLCTTLYKNGVDYLKTLLSGVEGWMSKHGFNSIDDFRGRLCQEAIEHPEVYERSQYVKALVGIS